MSGYFAKRRNTEPLERLEQYETGVFDEVELWLRENTPSAVRVMLAPIAIEHWKKITGVYRFETQNDLVFFFMRWSHVYEACSPEDAGCLS